MLKNFGSFGQARGTDPRQADRQKVLSNLVAGAIKSSSAIGAYNTTERWSRYPSRISPEAVSSNHNMSRVIYDRGRDRPKQLLSPFTPAIRYL